MDTTQDREDPSQTATVFHDRQVAAALPLVEALEEWRRLSPMDQGNTAIQLASGSVYRGREIERIEVAANDR